MKNFKDDQIDTMDRLLRKQLRAGTKPGRAQQCSGFDPDQASAYFEKALSPAEQGSYEQHLTDCHSCRKLHTEFGLFATEAVEEPAKPVVPVPEPRFNLFESLR